MKSEEEAPSAKGSVRIDIVERRHEYIICIYDIKTGKSGLSEKRIEQIKKRLEKNLGRPVPIIIIEIRPME